MGGVGGWGDAVKILEDQRLVELRGIRTLRAAPAARAPAADLKVNPRS